MRAELLTAVSGALLASALLTAAVGRFAHARGLLDLPNPRSSHSAATPRVGGIAVVLVLTAAVLALEQSAAVAASLCWALLGGGLAVAAVGLLDDWRSVAPALRLFVHGGAAVWALLFVGTPGALQAGSHLVQVGWPGTVIAAIAIVWILNLFNFMDGIDGIAAAEATFVSLGGALITLARADPSGIASVGLTLAAACLGFLVWNWPPARIFLGDVGSGYLGYVIAVLALAAARVNPTALWTWLVLGGLFFVDATVTLVRRMARGERIYQAHRSHAYQLLAQRWGSHRRVTLTVTAVNVLWLLPCAVLTAVYPTRAPWITLGALAPIVVATAIAGAGRRGGADTPMPGGAQR
jgi:Fuc2NAc and GlcNAc transferase